VNDDALMGLHADALFTYDEHGRMLWTNESDRRPPPRVFLGRTAMDCIARFRAALSATSVRRLEEIIDRWPPDGDLAILPLLRVAIQESITIDAPGAGESGGPVYHFPASIARPAETVEITDTNIEFVRDTYPWLYDDLSAWRPCFAVLVDGAARSVCFTSRVNPAAMEAGVETLTAYRRHGYAAMAAAAWGAAIQSMGRVPLYSTQWTNLASQAVARRAGLIMFGSDATWR
jgi:hypothetical protein